MTLLNEPTYDPNNLFDSLKDRLNLKNDAALSYELEVGPPVISNIRHKRIPISASLLIRIHDVTGLSIKDLRTLMGDRRDRFVSPCYQRSRIVQPVQDRCQSSSDRNA